MLATNSQTDMQPFINALDGFLDTPLGLGRSSQKIEILLLILLLLLKQIQIIQILLLKRESFFLFRDGCWVESGSSECDCGGDD